MAIQAGDKAPAFTLPAVTREGAKTVSLDDYRGRTVVLYFYPKDDTPGCTKEACSFRDLSAEFERENAAILGVSPDDEASHGKFIEKYSLPFPLLADEGAKVCQAYGVWVEKTNFGRTAMGVERTTFVIGPDGVVKTVFPKVRVEGHVNDVLAAVAA